MDNQDSPKSSANPEHWEREVLEKLVLATLAEQKASRRWGIFFKLALSGYLLVLLGVAVYPRLDMEHTSNGKHTAVINLVGMIAEDKPANAEDLIKSLREAVKDKQTQGIILHANSPGGSPVQSAYVYDEIRKIKKEHPQLPIYAVVSDICASGCYYIVSASDKIFVNPASLVGSIGVLMDGFGFVDAMKHLGIERRLLTAGSHKAMLDPFSPPKEEEVTYIKGLLGQVHQQFINAVKAGRGERLKEAPDTFSGLVWTGEAGVKLGIVDDFADEDHVARDIIGAEKRVDFTQREALIDRLAGKLGETFGQTLNNLAQGANLR